MARHWVWTPTTLEANAALRSIVRRDTGESYESYLKELARKSGIEEPSRADIAKLDKKRPKKGSNKEWVNPNEPDAEIMKMKSGGTDMAHKAEACCGHERGRCGNCRDASRRREG